MQENCNSQTLNSNLLPPLILLLHYFKSGSDLQTVCHLALNDILVDMLMHHLALNDASAYPLIIFCNPPFKAGAKCCCRATSDVDMCHLHFSDSQNHIISGDLSYFK
jgi:hypothetical protein